MVGLAGSKTSEKVGFDPVGCFTTSIARAIRLDVELHPTGGPGGQVSPEVTQE